MSSEFLNKKDKKFCGVIEAETPRKHEVDGLYGFSGEGGFEGWPSYGDWLDGKSQRLIIRRGPFEQYFVRFNFEIIYSARSVASGHCRFYCQGFREK